MLFIYLNVKNSLRLKAIEDHLFQEVKGLLSSPKKIVITTHHNPDGDAMGSSLGLYHYLIKQGHDVDVVIPNEFPEFLKWLPGNEVVIDFQEETDKAQELFDNSEMIFCLDYNSTGRVKAVEPALKAAKAIKVLIDHHPDPEPFADYTISDISVSSAAELVCEFMQELGDIDNLNKDIAECLYTGIMTDTINFTVNSSRPRTYAIVSVLLNYGINKDGIYNHVFNNYSLDRMRLLGYTLNEKTKVLHKYRTGYIYLTQEELDEYNHVLGDTEGFVNYPLSIKGVRMSAIFIEKEDHIKISFRSKGSFSVNEFSNKYFSGGGHRNAAGGESRLSMEETLEKFENLLPQYEEALNKE